VGLAIIGQSPDLVPADKRLYALRDVTATVDSIPLIAASIMSKKIAAGAGAIVLDVKVGSGAFMKSIEDARKLAEAMAQLGDRAARRVVALLTDMDQPLGWAIGNSLEVDEARATLAGEEAPRDLFSLAVHAAGRLVALSDLGVDQAEGIRRAEQSIDDGSALAAFERWIDAQGGDPSPDALPRAPVVREVAAAADGYVERVSAIDLGRVALELGAGRRTQDDPVDHAVGIRCWAKRGDEISAGQPLAELHVRDEGAAGWAAGEVEAGITIAPEPPAPRPIVLESIG
jgi:pyrimidine-nucleoside phosphorylase